MTRSQGSGNESLENLRKTNAETTSSPEAQRNQERASVEQRSLLQKVFIDAPVAVIKAPFQFAGRHPVLTTLGVAALAYFGAPWVFGRYAAGEAGGARAGVDWWSRFSGSLPRGPGLAGGGSAGAGMGGGYGSAPGMY